jgi:hypothetical protein
MLDSNVNVDDILMLLVDDNWLIQGFNLKTAAFFGIDPCQADLKKYVHSEEKIVASKLIPLLDDPLFINGLKTVESSEIRLDIAKIRRSISEEIEIVKKSPDEECELDSESSTSKFDDGYLKGMVSIIDLHYGSFNPSQGSLLNLKIIMIIVDQLLPKYEVC